MGIGMLAAGEPVGNAIAARGGKKVVQEGDGEVSGFKDLVGNQKGNKSADPETAAIASEANTHAWRHFGLHFGQGEGSNESLQPGMDEQIVATQSGEISLAPEIVAPVEPTLTIATANVASSDLDKQINELDVDVADDAAAQIVDPDAATGQPVAVAVVAAAIPTVAPRQNGGQNSAAPTARIAAAETAQNGAQLAAPPNPDAASVLDENGQRNQGRENRDGAAQQRMAPLPGATATSAVSVISSQIAPAPVQAMPMSDTSSAFATSLAAEVLPGDRADPTAQTNLTQNFGKAAPITTLKIQLHPAELGVVTARLSGTESQLSIAITVENAEARHRLAADSDAIISALKAMGIDVDRITIQQSQSGSGTSANSDGRGNEFRQSGESRGDGQGQSSRQGSGSGNDKNLEGSAAAKTADAAGGGVYI